MIGFAVFALTVNFLLHFYLWLRLVKRPELPRHWYLSLSMLIAMMAIIVISGFVFSHAISTGPYPDLILIPHGWIGFLFLYASLFVASDIGRFLLFLLKKRRITFSRRPQKRNVHRGIALAVFSLGSVLGSYAILKNAEQPRIKELRVQLDLFPPSMSGFHIVQITDLHLGTTLGMKWLSEVVEQINALTPDLVVITGDLADGLTEQIGDMLTPLAELRAPFGTYYVTGNHEYYFGAENWIKEIEKQGVKHLLNASVKIGSDRDFFYLIGLPDYTAGAFIPAHEPDIKSVVADLDPKRETILLAHQPREGLRAAIHNIGLVITGHTHGGQIWPFNYLVYVQQPFVKNLHRLGDRTQIYISAGTGYWGPPMRLGTRNEITSIIIND